MAFDWATPLEGLGGAATVLGGIVTGGNMVSRMRDRREERLIYQESLKKVPEQIQKILDTLDGIHRPGEPITKGIRELLEDTANELRKHLADHKEGAFR